MCTACGSPREARGQLLGDEHVGAVGDLQRAVDRVVVGDGHEVHAAALGQRVDLLGRRGALGQAERALDAELGDRRGGRVAVQVGPGGRRRLVRCGHARIFPANRGSSDRSVNVAAPHGTSTFRSRRSRASAIRVVELFELALGGVVAAGRLRAALGRAPGRRVGELLLERASARPRRARSRCSSRSACAALVLGRAGGARAAGAGAAWPAWRAWPCARPRARSSRTRRYSGQPPT